MVLVAHFFRAAATATATCLSPFPSEPTTNAFLAGSGMGERESGIYSAGIGGSDLYSIPYADGMRFSFGVRRDISKMTAARNSPAAPIRYGALWVIEVNAAPATNGPMARASACTA